MRLHEKGMIAFMGRHLVRGGDCIGRLEVKVLYAVKPRKRTMTTKIC